MNIINLKGITKQINGAIADAKRVMAFNKLNFLSAGNMLLNNNINEDFKRGTAIEYLNFQNLRFFNFKVSFALSPIESDKYSLSIIMSKYAIHDTSIITGQSMLELNVGDLIVVKNGGKKLCNTIEEIQFKEYEDDYEIFIKVNGDIYPVSDIIGIVFGYAKYSIISIMAMEYKKIFREICFDSISKDKSDGLGKIQINVELNLAVKDLLILFNIIKNVTKQIGNLFKPISTAVIIGCLFWNINITTKRLDDYIIINSKIPNSEYTDK